MSEIDPKSSSDFRTGCLIAVAIVFGFFIVVGIFSSKDIKSSSGQSSRTSSDVHQAPRQAPVEKKWYEGGTLHKAKIKEWKVSSYENKLATCADFIANITKELSLPKSVELAACIDESCKGITIIDESDVTEIAALCMILLQNQK